MTISNLDAPNSTVDLPCLLHLLRHLQVQVSRVCLDGHKIGFSSIGEVDMWPEYARTIGPKSQPIEVLPWLYLLPMKIPKAAPPRRSAMPPATNEVKTYRSNCYKLAGWWCLAIHHKNTFRSMSIIIAGLNIKRVWNRVWNLWQIGKSSMNISPNPDESSSWWQWKNNMMIWHNQNVAFLSVSPDYPFTSPLEVGLFEAVSKWMLVVPPLLKFKQRKSNRRSVFLQRPLTPTCQPQNMFQITLRQSNEESPIYRYEFPTQMEWGSPQEILHL